MNKAVCRWDLHSNSVGPWVHCLGRDLNSQVLKHRELGIPMSDVQAMAEHVANERPSEHLGTCLLAACPDIAQKGLMGISVAHIKEHACGLFAKVAHLTPIYEKSLAIPFMNSD